MLAPTRDLVSQLNQHAQHHQHAQSNRLPGRHPGPGAQLADSNTAFVGDTIVTRANDRRLRLGVTDWVKNGDRWTVQNVHPDGSLTVHHQRSGRPVTLPADYVAAAAELGYATTIHGAQGISVDTVHGLATGEETRQQLYTMVTRGSATNHLYLQVVGDGDPHDITRPENVHPRTATDILQAILARDDAPVSATTTARDHASPTLRLGAATARYLDAVHVAAEHHLGTTALAYLEAGAHRILPDIADDPAWPTLRNHLVLFAADGADPLAALQAAASARELDTSDDRAAVLQWRLPDPDSTGTGPLPWLPGIPAALHDDPHWGQYLTARSHLVSTLAAQVRQQAGDTPDAQPWWPPGRSLPTPDLLGDLAVWRAANAVPDSDHRPTGPTQPAKAQNRWQHELDTRLGNTNTATIADWTGLIHTLVPATRRDDYTPQLAERLAELSAAGVDAKALLHTTTGPGVPLPDDHAASALWWRIQRHLPDPTHPDAPDRAGPSAPQEPPMVRDPHAGPEEIREPRHRADRERRLSPVRRNQPRGPGMSR